jgi:phosphoribosylformimino-5-aminoimidazole carboxamide ribotide isomerase
MNIIPSIDIYNQKIVKLEQGNVERISTYEVSLTDMINQFSAQGTSYVNIADINGARGEGDNHEFILEAIKKSELKVQIGGGIRSIAQVQRILGHGVHRVSIGTIAVTDPTFLERLKAEVSPENIIIAIDILDYKMMIDGWTKESEISVSTYMDKCISLGYVRFLFTDISKDGILKGTSPMLFQEFRDKYPFIKLIVSGGIGSLADVKKVNKVKPESCIVGKAIYEKKISIKEIKEWNLNSLVDF